MKSLILLLSLPIQLAFEAMKKGGNMPCILNAANEVAVNAFLKDEIGFTDIPTVVEKCMAQGTFIAKTYSFRLYRK